MNINLLYLYGYWGLSNVDPCWYTMLTSLLVVLFFKSPFLYACLGRPAGTCDCAPTLKSAKVFSENSLVIWKTYLFPISEVPLVGWLGPWPCGSSNWRLETPLVVSGSCLVVSWNPGSAPEHVLDLFNGSCNCSFRV